ncbi:MAG: SEC-C domain-containing protein [Victivallales bacterium]|nr:SEC-C domain-containing protein [Victivallales bacterium]
MENFGTADEEIERLFAIDNGEEVDTSVLRAPKPIVRETPKINRNDPCPCGSGKKYKKCCGR